MPILIDVRDAGGEPVSAARSPNEEDRARAICRWYRRKHIVDFEVAVSRKRDTGRGAAVLSKRGGSSAN